MVLVFPREEDDCLLRGADLVGGFSTTLSLSSPSPSSPPLPRVRSLFTLSVSSSTSSCWLIARPFAPLAFFDLEVEAGVGVFLLPAEVGAVDDFLVPFLGVSAGSSDDSGGSSKRSSSSSSFFAV